MNHKQLLSLAAVALGMVAAPALAQHSVYVGGAYIDVHSKAAPLSFSPPKVPPINDARIEVDDASTAGFGYSYRFAPQWSFEAALGVPPKHKTYGRGALEPFGQLSTVTQVAPTVFVNYHVGRWGRFEPFVGVGLNYTKFTKGRSTKSGELAGGGPTDIKLSDSWGAAAHVGTSFEIDKRWSLITTVAYADVKSNLTATTHHHDGTTSRATTRIEFRPVVYTLCVGYNF